MARNDANVQGQIFKTPKGTATTVAPGGYTTVGSVGRKPVDDYRTGPNKAIRDKNQGGQ